MKTLEKLVSVIVPVYKVEPYLVRCIESIIKQSYKNIEVILVDDGSPDNCGKICDKYASSDSRIRVIHRANGGLSAARNSGIDNAKGKYILFVDSDDFIDYDLIEYSLSNLHKTDADIAFVFFELFYDSEDTRTGYDELQQNYTDFVATPVQALNEVLYEKNATLHSWAKLYKKELFKDVRFPEGRLFEDAGTTYKLILKSNKISISNAKKYHYLVRSGSIARSRFSPAMMDSVYFAQEILKITKLEQYEGALAAAETYLFMCAMGTFDNISSYEGRSAYRKERIHCWRTVKYFRLKILFNKQASRRARVYALIAILGHLPLILTLKIKKKLRTGS